MRTGGLNFGLSPPVLLAARSCGVGSWVLVGVGLKNGPPPSLKGVHAGRLDYYNNNNPKTDHGLLIFFEVEAIGLATKMKRLELFQGGQASDVLEEHDRLAAKLEALLVNQPFMRGLLRVEGLCNLFHVLEEELEHGVFVPKNPICPFEQMVFFSFLV